MLQCHPKANPRITRSRGSSILGGGKYKQALGVLRQAYDKPDGRLDPIISFYLAQTHLKQDNVKDAFKYGENALDFAYSAPRHAERIRSFMDELSSQYGPIEITSSASKGIIILASQSAFLNPKKRAIYDSVPQLASSPFSSPWWSICHSGNTLRMGHSSMSQVNP